MKTVVLGDTHGRTFWRLIYETEKPDRLIFIGDYFDSFQIPGLDQIQNYKDIIAFKESGLCEVVMLIGNHDYHYMNGVDEQYSGYQAGLAPSIRFLLDETKDHLRIAYQMDNILFTHAGVSSKFMDSVFGKGEWKIETIEQDLNELFKYKPQTFAFGAAVSIKKMTFLDPYGDNTEQSPIWIRPRSLMGANQATLTPSIVQVIGHTGVERILPEEKKKPHRYWLIDALETSGEYLVIEDGLVQINSIRSKKSKAK